MSNRPPAHPSPTRQLGQALRELQQRSSRTLRALEQQVAISDSSLSRYFRGDTVPPWPVVRGLCQALGADPAEYRPLWEAAERARPHEIPGATAAEPVAAGTRQPSASTRWDRMRALLTGRWAFAAAGASVGLLLTLFLVDGSPATPTAHGSGTERQEAGGSPSNPRKAPPSAQIFVNRSTRNCLDYGLRAFKCNHLPYPVVDHQRGLRRHTASSAQHWTINAGGDDAVTLRNSVTGHCLDDSSAGLRTMPCTPTSKQKWS
ncbi:helix-turn-helix domain-containing protein [Streptomyces sp. NPDC006285]|uniref:helix-turn-helix domain-containing protein n=1 Tax=Streptomyces sp. NPDC006285 TaxID=3364742 RepID=UPI00369643D7